MQSSFKLHRNRWDYASSISTDINNPEPPLIWKHYEGSLMTIGQSRTETVRNHQWQERIARGEGVTSPYTRNSVNVEVEPASIHINSGKFALGQKVGSDGRGYWVFGVNKYVSEGDAIFQLSAADIQESSTFTLAGIKATNKAATDLHEKAQEVYTQFAGMTFAGTIFETASGIRHPLQALVKGMTNFQKVARLATSSTLANGVKVVVKEAHQVIGGLWLETVFGWKPLVADIETAAETLADIYVGMRPEVVRCSGSGHDEQSSTSHVSSTTSVGGWAVNAKLDYTRIVSETIRILYVYGISDKTGLTDVQLSRRKLGLGLEQFAPTVYELTPYSFLLDYFSNIGDMINYMTKPSPSMVYGCKTTLMEKSIVYRGSVSPGYGYTGGGTAGSLKITSKVMVRDVMNQLPVIIPEVKYPDFSSQRWLNILALLPSGNKLSQRN